MDIRDIVTAVAIVTFLGATAAFLRGSADKGTIASLTASVAALKTENELNKSKLEAQNTRILALEYENTTLREFVTQKQEIANLTAMLDNHHRVALEKLSKIEEKVA